MLTLLFALALASPAQEAPADTPALPVSLDRIKAGLQRAPTLRIDAPPPEPTYRVKIVQHPYFLEVPFTWTFAGGGVPSSAPSVMPTSGIPWTPPLVQTDALPALKAARRALAERAARREVQQTIQEFCAQYTCVLR